MKIANFRYGRTFPSIHQMKAKKRTKITESCWAVPLSWRTGSASISHSGEPNWKIYKFHQVVIELQKFHRVIKPGRVDHLIAMTVPLGQRGGHPVQEVLCEGCCLEPTCPDNWHCKSIWQWWLKENVIFVFNNILVGSDSWQANNMESTFSWWLPIHDSLTAG